MRLTAELIQESYAHFNTLRDRELELRGCKIALIENLGATQDGFDTIDFTDNEIRKIGNFPVLRRLKTLQMSNNRVTTVDRDIARQIPGLQSLILTNNLVTSFTEIEALAGLKLLDTLVLVDNPVFRKQHYRLFTIHKLPSLRWLDFRKVKPAERDAAARLFASEEGKTVEEEVEGEEKTFVPGGEQKQLSAEEMERIKAAIQAATSAKEIELLEQQLLLGQVPEGK